MSSFFCSYYEFMYLIRRYSKIRLDASKYTTILLERESQQFTEAEILKGINSSTEIIAVVSLLLILREGIHVYACYTVYKKKRNNSSQKNIEPNENIEAMNNRNEDG